MTLKIIKSGAYTTLQDLGRNGWQAFGVPVGGAMDRKAARLANILLGNDENEAVLEMTLAGPTIQFDESAIIAIFGANMSPKRNGKAVEPRKPILVSKGDVVTFGAAKSGVRTYLAVKGGFSHPAILGSKSTNARANMGRPLQAGDVIPFKHAFSFKHFSWGLSYKLETYINDKEMSIRFVKGRQYDFFEKKDFPKSKYEVGSSSDRMGYRLTGPKLHSNQKVELITEGTTFGSIQVPPNGEPIILMADRQPTGGYPKIGEVISCDLPRLSQIRPGELLRFKEISLKKAQQLLIAQEKELKEIKAACQVKWRDFKDV
ncbi:biotin-dependent carboxyltransferase family protein [Lederbergia wuyishanensis]|uniref:Antagonist of KipI n=1 Tax=Lederbergia wuyishanensis TaxID=1347903 RepID=A0ABU0DA71_9BACI|nr:biotin-dependent carboxyltransferase family protein [Lederbergia wuyishanensis]MCJ8010093.1 biotin-dependent carboxyltransferase family protein [Lederbergia wuyishanensis]MDQ0345332.1 antagonist of KipI [Lederbergia wuyishanensis]